MCVCVCVRAQDWTDRRETADAKDKTEFWMLKCHQHQERAEYCLTGSLSYQLYIWLPWFIEYSWKCMADCSLAALINQVISVIECLFECIFLFLPSLHMKPNQTLKFISFKLSCWVIKIIDIYCFQFMRRHFSLLDTITLCVTELFANKKMLQLFNQTDKRQKETKIQLN